MPQRSALSSFIFNAAIVALPQYLPRYKLPTLRLAMYAGDVVIWCVGSAERTTTLRFRFQTGINRAADYLHSIGLNLLPMKSANLVYRPHHLCQTAPKGGFTRRTSPLEMTVDRVSHDATSANIRKERGPRTRPWSTDMSVADACRQIEDSGWRLHL